MGQKLAPERLPVDLDRPVEILHVLGNLHAVKHSGPISRIGPGDDLQPGDADNVYPSDAHRPPGRARQSSWMVMADVGQTAAAP